MYIVTVPRSTHPYTPCQRRPLQTQRPSIECCTPGPHYPLPYACIRLAARLSRPSTTQQGAPVRLCPQAPSRRAHWGHTRVVSQREYPWLHAAVNQRLLACRCAWLLHVTNKCLLCMPATDSILRAVCSRVCNARPRNVFPQGLGREGLGGRGRPWDTSVVCTSLRPSQGPGRVRNTSTAYESAHGGSLTWLMPRHCQTQPHCHRQSQ